MKVIAASPSKTKTRKVQLGPTAPIRVGKSSEMVKLTIQHARALTGQLSERETEVPTCLGQGLSNAQIGERLHLSEATVKGYVSRVLDKLGCANRTQAGLLAYDAGLVSR